MNTMMTRPNIFEHMKQFLDTYSKTTNYMLQELKSNGIIYNSYFDSKKKAQIYAKSICDESSTIYIYKSYCMKIYDPVDNMDDEPVDNIDDEHLDNMDDEPVDNMDDEHLDNIDENYDPEMDLTNMTLWSYGKGWLLEPNEDSDYYGKKYFHEGWWVESQNGWFFKDEHYQWLIDHGVVLSTDDDDTMEPEVDSTEVDLSNMTLWSYGKGWLLEPLQDDEYFGEKYFHEGWWMPKQNGWFFKDEHYQWLIDHDVVLSTDDDTMESDVESKEVNLSNMTLWSYGKGWLLEPLQDDEYFGEKYFHEGWWMPKQNGWFFKDEHYQWLIDHDVVLSTDDDTMESDVEYTDVNLSNMKHGSYGTDLSKMSLEEYGKGYILKTTKKDTLYGDKYFMDGFWNKGQKGWFFKSYYFDELINMGAKYIKTEEEQENILYNSTELSSSITNDSFEYVYDDNEFMTNEDRVVPKFNKYGKGWILKADNNYKYSKGLEYFEGGWWIPSIKGWFFKSSQKKEFMKKHFEI